MKPAPLHRAGSLRPVSLATLLTACLAQPALAQEATGIEIRPAPVGSAVQNSGPLVGPPAPDAPASPAEAEPKKKGFFHRFFDEEDGQLDFSNFLAKGGFIPVPIIITEPAVDGGFGLAAAFITVPEDHPRWMTRRAAAAFKTGNGSYGYGYFQAGKAFQGRMDYKFGVGRGQITLDSFPAFAPQGIEYTNHFKYGILGSARWHLGDDRFSIGPLVDFRKLSSELNVTGLPPDFADHFNRTLKTGALGLGFHFDSRDNPLTPTKGTNAYVEGKFNRDAFGSDRDYEVYDAEAYTFGKISSSLRYGLKLEFDAIRGDFPVYFAPAIDLRGVQAMQYQGMNALNTEAEITWQLSRRWSLLAFGGVGASYAGSTRFYNDSGAVWAGGGGFRYRIARKLGLDAGLDLAYGPGGFTFYLQFGHAWSFGMD